MRQDLLALSMDDLITLSNRGIVKRSQQELQSDQLTYELDEDETGNVSVQWSDQVQCQLPSDRTLRESVCTCPATTLCRHLVRSVLVYQQLHSSPTIVSETAPWNPGEMSDAAIAQLFKKATLTKLRNQFDEGHVVSLTRGHKPSAHIHTLSCTVRFLVPGDLRYTHCDCAESAPCSHVPLAVWAFRLLESAQGLVSTRQTAFPVPTALLDEIEQQLAELAESGIAGAPQAWHDRSCRLELRCRENSLIWLAEILAELVQEYDRYTQHDARFSPQHLLDLIGELCIRSDAIRRDTGAVPQLFIRGSQADRTIEVGSARLIGLGCGVELKHNSAELTAYCQDVDSGTIVALCHSFLDPAEDPAKPFEQLAKTPVVKGVSLAQLGTGQLLVKGGKRTPSYQFLPGRAPVSFNPQAYQWESLRSHIEDFAELSDYLSTLPPASLRPRRLSENLFVCQVAQVETATFNPIEQTVQAVLCDRQGNRMTLIHPYTSRGQAGVEALLNALTQHPEALEFVAGRVQLGSYGLTIAPISLILQRSGNRTMLQPWIDSVAIGAPPSSHLSATHVSCTPPHLHYLQDLIRALSELWTLGLRRADAQILRTWQALEQQGAALGFIQLLQPIQHLATALAQKATTLHWEDASAGEAMRAIALLVKLAQEQ